VPVDVGTNCVIWMVICWLAVIPAESATDAAIVCVPTERLLVENEPPVPIRPSRFEVHAMLDVRLPSSASLAVPAKFTVATDENDEKFVGVWIWTTGALLTAVTVIGRIAIDEPPGPLTRRVAVQTPGLRNVWLTLAPDTAPLPTPVKLHTQDVISPVEVLFKVTVSGAVPAGGFTVKDATGAAGGGALTTIW